MILRFILISCKESMVMLLVRASALRRNSSTLNFLLSFFFAIAEVCLRQ